MGERERLIGKTLLDWRLDTSALMYENFFQNNLWYGNNNYKRFWRIYNELMYYTHQPFTTSTKLSKKLASFIKPQFSHKANVKNFTKLKKKKNKKKRRLKRRLAKEKRFQSQSKFVLSENDNLQVQLNEKLNIDESRFIEDEYLEFLKQSVAHKIKWSEIKAKKEENENLVAENKLKLLEKNESNLRHKEMHNIYGSSAPQIIGMETAMQLSFDRISTHHKPTVWPNIPIKL